MIWFNVNKKIPNTNRPVLVYTPNKAIPMQVDWYDRYYGEDDGEWYEGWALHINVTHWCELPNMPADESGDK